jgi:HlyD family secretion protein
MAVETQTAVTKTRRWWKWVVIVVLVLGLAAIFAMRHHAAGSDEQLASGNGRIEATEIDIDAKIPGRIKQIMVEEGDFVKAGQVVARMDTETLEAQLREAQAKLQEAIDAVETARSQLVQREAEKRASIAVVAQREAEFNVGKKRFARSSSLATDGAMTQLEADDDQARMESGGAAVATAQAQVAAADAAIVTARTQIGAEESKIEAARAGIQRIQADIKDSVLRSPRDGRVQYKVAQVGEVLGAGGRVLNVVDLSDVYMTFFLPTELAGRLKVGSEARIVLDAMPQYVIPARLSFVADVAQFTPKTVETKTERDKLMFRIKAQISPELLRQHITQVKTGLPGVAHVLLDPNAEWPPNLAVRAFP